MKIETLDVKRDLAENEVAMSIDEAGMARLMTTLSGVYEKPPVAVLREYTSNAFDSHVKAGVNRPVLVTYPKLQFDSLSMRQRFTGAATLTIEDFGVGMDEAELRALYGKYGASTKVNSNREIGGFGIGAKSALSISDTYSVRSRKDGVEVSLTLTKGKDGVGVLAFSKPIRTDEPNGVKVTIPINQGHQSAIERAVRWENFFIAAPTGAVLVNGESPNLSVHDRTKFVPISRASEPAAWVEIHSNEAYCSDTKDAQWNERVRFVIGGVLYPAYKDMFNNTPLDGSAQWWENMGTRFANLTGDLAKVYINLPIGGIKLAPNREKIQLIESNARTIRATLDEFFALLPKAFSSAANKIDDRQQALDFISANWRMLVANNHEHPGHLLDQKRRFANLSAKLHSGDFRWRDLEVPTLLPTGSKGWVSVNGAKGTSIESREHAGGSPIPALTDLISNGLRKQPLLRILVEVPDLDEASIKSVRNLLRAYGESALKQINLSAYLVPQSQVSGKMRDVFHTVKLADFERIAKDHRRYLNSLIERKPKSAIQFLRVSKQGDGVKLNSTLEGSESLKEAVFFSGLDAGLKAKQYTAVYRMFSAVKKDGGSEIATGGLQSAAPAYLTRYLNKPLYLIGTNRNAKVVAKNFDEANNLLWHVYRDAQKQLASMGEAQFGAMVASGSVFGVTYSYQESVRREPLNLLAQHAQSLRSERLRHALTFHNDATEAQMNLARVLGMIDWSRFASENDGLDPILMSLLGKWDESRFSAWFDAFAKIKADNAKVIATVLDALATHHGWA